MKTSLKMLLPILAFALASAGAVKTETSKSEVTKTPPPINAFVQNPTQSQCVDVTANCSTNDTHVNCMSIEQPTKRAYLKTGGQCSVELWKIL